MLAAGKAGGNSRHSRHGTRGETSRGLGGGFPAVGSWVESMMLCTTGSCVLVVDDLKRAAFGAGSSTRRALSKQNVIRAVESAPERAIPDLRARLLRTELQVYR